MLMFDHVSLCRRYKINVSAAKLVIIICTVDLTPIQMVTTCLFSFVTKLFNFSQSKTKEYSVPLLSICDDMITSTHTRGYYVTKISRR